MRKKIAVLSPVAWRTPPKYYGAWETVASNIAEGLHKRGWDVTLFATKDSITKAKLHAVIDKGYEEDKTVDPKVVECLHISEVFEHANEFDLIHNNYDFLPLTYSRLIKTPILTTIHGFSSSKIIRVFKKYTNTYFVSISNSDRISDLSYIDTVYNGINTDQITFHSQLGSNLVWLGRIHPDKGVHLAIEVAKKTGMDLIIAGIIQDQTYFNDSVKPHIDNHQIKFIGRVNPVTRNKLFKSAYTVLHLNTIPERFGLVIAEAMAAGIPVIAMDKGSCKEIIEHNKTGFLVNNVQEACQAITQIPNIDRYICRKRVEKHFSIEKMVEKYESVYKRIFQLESIKNR